MQRMLGTVRKAVDKYNMISGGDKIAVGVSGGKDSLVLLTVLSRLREFYPALFEVIGISAVKAPIFPESPNTARNFRSRLLLKKHCCGTSYLKKETKKIRAAFVHA